MEVGPLGLGSVMALRLLTSSPISTRLLSGRKKELEVSGFIFSFFFFFAKGLLPVPELWLSPPGLSLQLTVHWRTERMHVCA